MSAKKIGGRDYAYYRWQKEYAGTGYFSEKQGTDDVVALADKYGR